MATRVRRLQQRAEALTRRDFRTIMPQYAAVAKVKWFVVGDMDLLTLGTYKGARIVMPVESLNGRSKF